MSVEEMEFTGYLVSIRPRTRRGLVEYELKLISFGGEPFVAYTMHPPSFITPAIQVRVKVILSRQLGAPRWVIDDMSIISGPEFIEVTPAVIEEVARGVYPIVSGRIGERAFSVPVDEELLLKIPPQLPSAAYCVFMKKGPELRLIEIMSEKEYQLFRKALKLVSEIEKEVADAEEAIRGYLVEAEAPITT